MGLAGFYEAIEHFCDGVAFLLKVLILGNADIANFKGDDSLSENFGIRTLGNIEMPDGLGVGAKFISFSNIARNTDCRSTDLIPQAKIPAKLTLISHLINPNCQMLALLPNL
jgi:hypothetical protein